MPSGQLSDPGASGAADRAPNEPNVGAELPTDPDVAITELYRAQWHRLVRLAWLLLRDQLAAEDVVQNTWLKLVEHAPSIADPQSVLKWLITTTKRDSWAVVARRQRDLRKLLISRAVEPRLAAPPHGEIDRRGVRLAARR